MCGVLGFDAMARVGLGLKLLVRGGSFVTCRVHSTHRYL